MAVYTEVSFAEARQFLIDLRLGELQTMTPCAGGIENTNYFVTTDQAAYVLTLFERLRAEQLPYYLRLMKHLAHHDIAVPDPVEDGRSQVVHGFKGKPAAVVSRLPGKSALAPTPAHCALVGTVLARMHLAARDFGLHQPHLRGLAWWRETVPVVLPFVQPEQAALLHDELAYQEHIATLPAFLVLPRGPIHADLFRDNVLFDTPAGAPDTPALTGVFDFYFAGEDTWLFDLAVCLNDWCVVPATGAMDAARTQAFVAAYTAVRSLQDEEYALLPALLRAGALRFWISRLWDYHLPREAAVLQAHDPGHFERVLRQRIAHPPLLANNRT